jgi:Ca2+/H+ antiporter, TMEM165/GDT1 family
MISAVSHGGLALVLSTFGIIFVAELPDKTALASLVLATRYRVIDVIEGAWLAFLVQTVISIAAGGLLHALPAKPVHVAAGLAFLLFAVLALRRKESEELAEEAEAVEQRRARRRAPWLTCFLVVFAAEWGDLTQLATATLAARSGQPLAVALGAVPALWAVTVLAATVGAQASRFLSAELLNRTSAALFLVVGVFMVVTALF